MITSDAPGHIIEKMRRLSGPNPEGSKLTDVERLHLIFLLGTMMEQELGSEFQGLIVQSIAGQLMEIGMTQEEILGLFPGGGNKYSAVDVADMIAIHPGIRSADYLD